MKKRRGLFITLEGNEGCGKSTQIRLLEKYLKAKGYSVFRTREPGGTAIGDAIRCVVLDPRHKSMTPLCETLLYMASRAQLVAEEILPRLNRGQVVLCDRWLDATLAYQGYAGGVGIPFIRQVGEAATQGLKPDISLYLDLPVRAGLKRALKHHLADRIEKKTVSYHEKVRQGFLSIAKSEPRRFRRISLHEKESIEHVQERIRAELGHVLRRR